MKYCTHCGAELVEEAAVCVKCGRSVGPNVLPAVHHENKDETMVIVVKVFLILGCIAQGWMLLPLAWCIPMTVSIFHCFRDQKPIHTGMKVCTHLFVSLVAGICLLCMNEPQQ